MTKPYKVEEFNLILNKLSLLHEGKKINPAFSRLFVNCTGAISVVPLVFLRYVFLRYPGLTFHLKVAHEAITLRKKGRLQCETLILRPTSFHGGVAA